ncbi:MAG: hypothetical protein AABZ41_01050 [Bacteroidota bacterium]
MKTILQLLSTIFLLTCISAAQLKIDLKTPVQDKEKLKLAKAGLGAFLRQADWAHVVNVGEDYSVWIKNLKRRFKGNILHFELDLEIKSAADLTSGKPVSVRHIKDSVDLAAAAELKTFEAREMNKLVEEQLTKNNKFKPVSAVVGTVTNVPVAGGIVEKGLEYFGVDLESKFTPDQAIEGMTLGAVMMIHLKEMIDAIPPKKK